MSTVAPAHSTTTAGRQQPMRSETRLQMETLAQRLQVMLPASPSRGQIVGITSCSRREGVSVVAGNLAVCAAKLYDGRVLLTDANARHASLASRFGVSPTPGMTDHLTTDIELQACIGGTRHPKLSVLPWGTPVRQTPRFADERAVSMFDELRKEFELIVVDLPPVGEMAESLVTSGIIDGFLIVIEAERVRRHVAQRAKYQLEQANASLLGVVLNKRKNHIPEWLYRRL